MKYTDKIHFANVKDFQGQISAGPLSVNNNYTVTGDNPDNATITKISQKVINAVDIDWNEACFNVYETDASDPEYKIRTTGDLLDALKECIDTSYTRANEAYELALTASGGIELPNSVLEFRDNKSNFYNFVLPSNKGVVKLSYINNNSYLPVNINFESNDNRIDFGISKNTLLSYLKTTDLGGEGIEYSDGYGIVIDDDHVISVNTDAIAERDYVDDKFNSIEIPSIDGLATTTYVSEYVSNNSIKTIGLEHPLHFSNTSTTTPEIGIKYDETYFTTKLLSDTATVKALTLTDTIINKINSAGSQGIEYSAGNGISIDNNTISIDNTVALKSEIPNVSNYLTKGGVTTGTLAVINGTQVNESNATTNGTDIFISSDKKLKDNILDIRQDEVDKLFATESGNMHYFEWKENHKPSFGFIAQELMDFAPETVTKDSEYMQVNYNAALTKTCAALFKKIKELENRIQKLENK